MEYIAHTVKGLDEIAKHELTQKLNDFVVIIHTGKYQVFSTTDTIGKLVSLRTIDDIGIVVHDESGAPDITLNTLAITVAQLNFDAAQEILSQYRAIDPLTFSITASVYKQSFIGSELQTAVAETLMQQTDRAHLPRDHTNFDIRILIDEDNLIVSVRIPKESLFHRAYKTVSLDGTLRPTIAATMVRLATQNISDVSIVDDFCGSGTILAEAFLQGNDVCGGDIQKESVSATKTNLRNAGYKEPDRIKLLDATHSPWQDNQFDCAVSNLPWGKQIAVESITKLYERTVHEYYRILKPTGTLCLLVPNPQLLIKHIKQVFGNKVEITQYPISYLGQTPTIVVAWLR